MNEKIKDALDTVDELQARVHAYEEIIILMFKQTEAAAMGLSEGELREAYRGVNVLVNMLADRFEIDEDLFASLRYLLAEVKA